MKKWKYRKGCEKDFDGAPEWATVVVNFNGTYIWEEHEHPIIGSSRYQNIGEDNAVDVYSIDTLTGGEIIAQREPVTECTFQDGVVFDAPIGMPLNAFKCRQQPLNASDSDANINGIPLNKITPTDVEVVKYDPTKVDIESLVTERGNRYGKFADGAKIMRSLKAVMHNTDGWSRLTESQREALDMIQHKIGRILNGDPTYDDSWKDIAGYATLIVNELNGEIK